MKSYSVSVQGFLNGVQNTNGFAIMSESAAEAKKEAIAALKAQYPGIEGITVTSMFICHMTVQAESVL